MLMSSVLDALNALQVFVGLCWPLENKVSASPHENALPFGRATGDVVHAV